MTNKDAKATIEFYQEEILDTLCLTDEQRKELDEAFYHAIKALEGWDELKETIKELSENEGVLTQQEVCKFLVNLMEVIEGGRK